MQIKALSWLRRLAVRHPFVTDLVFSVAVTGTTVAFAIGFSQDSIALSDARRGMDAAGMVLILLPGLALAWRRRAPLSVLVIACAAAIAFHAAGYDTRLAQAPPLLALYTLASRRSPAVSLACA